MTDPANILFVGTGSAAQCWYRCALPARALGADWVGGAGEPGAIQFYTGQAQRPLRDVRDFFAYEVVVLQLVHGRGWLRAIRDLQAAGVKVVYEIDDYVHGVAKAKSHAYAHRFDKALLADLELTMRACDAIVCSTDYIASRYRGLNASISVCQNGLDVGRYALTRRPRETVTVGWAGGTGHRPALLPWLHELLGVMDTRPDVRLMTVGDHGYVKPFAERFGAERAVQIGWTPIEIYPAAMSNFDIAIAPATNSGFFRGKSDLRFLEAAALGIPVVADPLVYPTIEDGVTGLHARTPAEARAAVEALAGDGELRSRIGDAARSYVREHRTSAAVAPQWAAVFDRLTSMAQAA